MWHMNKVLEYSKLQLLKEALTPPSQFQLFAIGTDTYRKREGGER